MGKPPALPGDSQSLTVPGVYESFPLVNRSKLTERKAFVWMSIQVYAVRNGTATTVWSIATVDDEIARRPGPEAAKCFQPL